MSSSAQVNQQKEQELTVTRRERDIARQERDQALNQATNWRKRYQTEAQQRRLEAQRYQQLINQLQTQVRALENPGYSQNLTSEEVSNLEQQVNKLRNIEEIRFRLAEVLLEKEKLHRALLAEQAQHRQARQNLTTALGDAIETLGLYRKALPPGALGQTALSRLNQGHAGLKGGT